MHRKGDHVMMHFENPEDWMVPVAEIQYLELWFLSLFLAIIQA